MFYLALTLFLLAQAALFALACRWRPRYSTALQIGGFLAMIAWARWGYDSVWLYQHLPCTYGFVLYNFTPLLCAGILGLSTAQHQRKRVRIVAYGMLLVCLDIYYFGGALVGGIECGNETRGPATLQTTDHTCGPAAAATLLRQAGIESDEQTMARLCRTSTRGTSLSQLYMGLSTACAAQGRRVVVRRMSVQELLADGRPALLSVALSATVGARDRRYEQEWGWIPGVPHAVVFLTGHQGRVRMIDPKIGVETWDTYALDDLWSGTTLRIE